MMKNNDYIFYYDYFNWLCDKITPLNSHNFKFNHELLLNTLYSLEYVTDDYMDKNRLIDGLTLRNRYSEENNFDIEMINSYICGPCSMLEMMVALAIRCEETIMCDPTKPDRTPYWFEEMLYSLGLNEQCNEVFDYNYVVNRINIFLNKQYESNGYGGLFVIHNSKIDMRTKDIWYQMQAYLCEYDTYLTYQQL